MPTELPLVGYVCDHCGLCCTKLIVEADVLDVMREPRLLEADPQWRGVPVARAVHELQSEEKVVTLGGKCPFLAESRCSIYPTRPNVCVGFEAGDEKCQELREEAGLLRLQPVNGSRSLKRRPTPASSLPPRSCWPRANLH